MQASLFKIVHNAQSTSSVREQTIAPSSDLTCLDALAQPPKLTPTGVIIQALSNFHNDTRGGVDISKLKATGRSVLQAVRELTLALKGAKPIGEGIILEHTFNKHIRKVHLMGGRSANIADQSHESAVRRTISNIRLSSEELNTLLRCVDQGIVQGKTASAGASGIFLLAVNEIARSVGLAIEPGVRRDMRRALADYQGHSFSIAIGDYQLNISPYNPNLIERLSYKIGEKIFGYPKAQRWCHISFGKPQHESLLNRLDPAAIKPWAVSFAPAFASSVAAVGLIALAKIGAMTPEIASVFKAGIQFGFATSGAILVAKLLSHLPISERLTRNI